MGKIRWISGRGCGRYHSGGEKGKPDIKAVINTQGEQEVRFTVTGNCAGCSRAGTCGRSGCAGCGGGTLYLTEGEIALLRRFGEIPFWPLARRADAEEPVCLEDEINESATQNDIPALLSALAQKGLIRLDYYLPLTNFDYRAYAACPHHGSMALTALGQRAVEVLETRGVEAEGGAETDNGMEEDD